MTRPLGSTPTAPSRDFTATTGRSASTPRDGTHCLHGCSRSTTPSRHPRQQCRGVPSAAVVAGPLLDDSITSVTADGQGSHTVTTDKVSTTTQSGIADSSGRLTVDQIDPNSTDLTRNGRYDPATGQVTGHFVVGDDLCSGQCP